MRVLNAQQLLGLLGVDAAQLSEDTHNLQEQEPVSSQRSRGFSPPFPSHQTDPLLRAHKFNLRKSKQDVEFLQPMREKAEGAIYLPFLFPPPPP